MGFPVGYTELLLPKFLLHTLSFLGLLRNLINALLRFLGLPSDFLEPDVLPWPSTPATPPVPTASATASDSDCCSRSISAVLLREILPVVRFSDLVDPPDSCAVCLYEFEDDDEIRRLTNCRHVFHRRCLDRWMGYDRMTCPLCRKQVVPDDMQEVFNERLWAASGIPDFYGEFSGISAL